MSKHPNNHMYNKKLLHCLLPIVVICAPGCKRRHHEETSKHTAPIDNNVVTTEFCDGTTNHTNPSDTSRSSNSNVKNKKGDLVNSHSIQPDRVGHGCICTVTPEKKKEAYNFAPAIANTGHLESIHKSTRGDSSHFIHVDISATTAASNAIRLQSASADSSNVFPNYISIDDPAQSLKYIASLEERPGLAKSIDKGLQELPTNNAQLPKTPKNLDAVKEQLNAKNMCESVAKIINSIIKEKWSAYMQDINTLTDLESIDFSDLSALWVERSESASYSGSMMLLLAGQLTKLSSK